MPDSTDDEQAAHRRALRVLRMVAELHQDGYQRIRIVPGMSSSGMSWRCSVTARDRISLDHGALLSVGYSLEPPHVATYTSASENQYFGWGDAQQATARGLAELFVARFPQICDAGRGQDWEYAGWYAYMLGEARLGPFPVAYDDDYGPPPVAFFRTFGRPLRTLLPPSRPFPAHMSACTRDASSGAWTVPRYGLSVRVPPDHTASMLMMRAVEVLSEAAVPEPERLAFAAEVRAAPDGESMTHVVGRWMRIEVG